MTRFRLVTYNFLLQIQSLDPKNELDHLRTILWFLRFHVPTWWTRWKKYLSQQNDPSHDPSLKSQNFCCWLLVVAWTVFVLVVGVVHHSSRFKEGWSVLQCLKMTYSMLPLGWPVLMVAHHRIWTHCYKLRVHHTRRCDMMTWDFNLVVYVFISQVEDRWQAMRMHGGWVNQRILIWKKKIQFNLKMHKKRWRRRFFVVQWIWIQLVLLLGSVDGRTK